MRAELVMSLLAIGWEPELRGILTVIIGVVVLCGSVYMIMASLFESHPTTARRGWACGDSAILNGRRGEWNVGPGRAGCRNGLANYGTRRQ